MDTNTVLIVFLVIILIIMVFITHITIINTHPIRPVPVPIPTPAPSKLIGGCSGTQYGCCPNGRTARVDQNGSNC
jgi:hypothetical protein